MCDHTLHYGKKHFYSYCFQAFNTEEILKRHINHILNLAPPQLHIFNFCCS